MPIVRRRHEPEKPSDDRISDEPRESIAVPRQRQLGPMREPMPTAEFSPDALAEALERLRAEDPEYPPPPVDEGPRRTRSGERSIVRPPVATPPAAAPVLEDDGPIIEARIEEYEEDEGLAPTSLASEPPPRLSWTRAVEPVVAHASRELGVSVTPMELAPLPVAIVPMPERAPMPAPLLPTLQRKPRGRGLAAILLLLVLAAVVATVVLALTHRL